MGPGRSGGSSGGGKYHFLQITIKKKQSGNKDGGRSKKVVGLGIFNT